ncbi:response regulator transcription factor [bacterium]|nr:response regulator transcription factor [bacterium]
MYRILIVEDHALIRFGLKTAFESKDFIKEIYEAGTGEEAVETVKKHKIDAVIMDLGLPSMDGIEATKRIKAFSQDIKVLVLTSHNSEEEVIASLRAGANAYCSKDVNPDSLAQIVKSVIEGAAWFDPKVAHIVLNAVANDKSKLKSLDEFNLTDREKQVLMYLREGDSNGEIAKKLQVSINTVKVHVSSIIQKLGVEDRTQAAIKALGCNIS